MMYDVTKTLKLGVAAALAAGVAATDAQTAPAGTIGGISNIEQITSIVDAALPPILAGDNSAIATQLLNAPIAPPLSETFSPRTALHAVLGHEEDESAPDCRHRTHEGDKDDDDHCKGGTGSSDGSGAYRHLSENLALGNIRYLSRPAFNPNFVAADLKPVTISDADALSRSVSLLSKGFGLSPTEFPLPPASIVGTKPTGFVSSLIVRGNSSGGDAAVAPTVIQKLVHIRRGVLVNLPADTSGHMQTYVPAPGEAKVLMDAKGIVGVMIENWRELRSNPSANPKLAKSRDMLVNEIAQDLLSNGGSRIAHLSAHITYGSDCRDAGFCYLVPAVQVYVAPATGTLNSDQLQQIIAGKIGTAGFVREYALINPDPALLPTR